MSSSTVDPAGEPIPTSAVLMSSAKHIASRCRNENLAFLKCKKDDPNPEKCLDKGEQVTRCVLSLWTVSSTPNSPPFPFQKQVLMVDDKYQYSCDDKDNRVYGWICSNLAVGFWMITPSDEFRTGGPVKQDLTSHVGPTTLSMFFSTHYLWGQSTIKLRDGEPWKKVFGLLLIYLNSPLIEEDALTLWEDAKEQMLIETQSWPYDFRLSEDFPHVDQRGTISGQLLVRDK
ncbi:NADH dehydrogenase [ubiquinone] 1 alpha subcomplex subunit 8-B [Camellia lanceoleosa]|uniref:NADH dehydrogenase [ubiquinone] 1 alpha subcomplex subunit 8-B n=1 Tax=Camellia lanceoleosa TaxID=1840588 RepID=A0ACC0IE84_9ERIC|nr:NADH dehydrogenase [ubiquinone] 1 alpha subcomplex subunit 8-B [Camellia lanceoleosa]